MRTPLIASAKQAKSASTRGSRVRRLTIRNSQFRIQHCSSACPSTQSPAPSRALLKELKEKLQGKQECSTQVAQKLSRPSTSPALMPVSNC